VKAINLIPADTRRSGPSGPRGLNPASYLLFGLLVAAVALVTAYVLTSNKVAERKAQLASLQAQVSQQQALASRLSAYAQFSKLAQTRIATVEGIAATRFDWYAALTDLAKVVPANTTLQSLSATVAPGAGGGAVGAGGAGSLRPDLQVPALTMSGCTSSHEAVAQLMSRLRLINGVTRVSLADSQKSQTAAAPGVTSGTGVTIGTGATSSAGGTSSTSSTGSSGPCAASGSTFDLVVFFSPIPGAGPNGATALGTTTAQEAKQ
jgi:Tfp pilus assembly protein PilN